VGARGRADEEEARRVGLGWTPDARARISTRCRELLELPLWQELSTAELARDHDELPWQAVQVARRVGIDVRGFLVRHIERHPEDTGAWFELVHGADEPTLDQALALAGRLCDLQELAEGPGDELHRPGVFQVADALLQELVGRPGKGWEVIGPALQSPVVRNRHFAVRALSHWPPELVTGEIRTALDAVVRDDPSGDVRANAERLLRGRPLDESTRQKRV
jgi:hypothetical protein